MQQFVKSNIFELIRIMCVSIDSVGGSTVEACQLCPPGHYCQQRGMAEPSGLCVEGYYCPEGQSSDRPQQHVCSVGHFCLQVNHPVFILSYIIAQHCWVYIHESASFAVSFCPIMKSVLLHTISQLVCTSCVAAVSVYTLTILLCYLIHSIL